MSNASEKQVDPSVKQVVKLSNAGLMEANNGEIIGHGWLDIDSMGALRVGTYQREVLARTGGKKTALQLAVEKDVNLPDIVLGMRGQRFRNQGNTMVLEDPVFIVDGLQRVFTLKQHAELHPDKVKDLRIGAEVRFGTTNEVEKELFHALNVLRTPMSPNVTLRNEREKNRSVLTLYGLSTSDSSSPLHARVQWNQRRNRGELFTALVLARVACMLHRHHGSSESTGVRQIVRSLEHRAETTGLKVYRENIIEFFETVDAAWGLRKIEFRQTATQMRSNFLLSLARVMSDHVNFWQGESLVVSNDMRKKLGTFPLGDPEIMRLAAAGTMALPLLYNYLRDHLNKGKRVNRLQERRQPASRDMDDEE